MSANPTHRRGPDCAASHRHGVVVIFTKCRIDRDTALSIALRRYRSRYGVLVGFANCRIAFGVAESSARVWLFRLALDAPLVDVVAKCGIGRGIADMGIRMAASLNRTFGCPVELALEMLGGKWKPVILALLKTKPQRYSELRRRLPRLSDKMLTQRLNDLSELGLVTRRKATGRGAQSTYALTSRGKSLRPALQGLYDWGRAVAPEVGARLLTSEQD